MNRGLLELFWFKCGVLILTDWRRLRAIFGFQIGLLQPAGHERTPKTRHVSIE